MQPRKRTWMAGGRSGRPRPEAGAQQASWCGSGTCSGLVPTIAGLRHQPTPVGPPAAAAPLRCRPAELLQVQRRYGLDSALAARLQLHDMKPKTSREHKGGSKAKRKESKEKSPSVQPRERAHRARPIPWRRKRGKCCANCCRAALGRLVRTQWAAACCKAKLGLGPAHTMPAGRWITPVPEGARGRKMAACGDSAAGCIAASPRDQAC